VAAKDRRPQPNWAAVHRELRRPGVTLQLLWEEHRAVHPGGYGYSRYCELYRAWETRLSPTMRQSHTRSKADCRAVPSISTAKELDFVRTGDLGRQ
jgi:transposase